MEIVTVAIGIISLAAILISLENKIDIVKQLVFSIAGYFMIYSIVVDLLIAVSRFSIENAAVITTLLGIAGALTILCKKKVRLASIKDMTKISAGRYMWLLPALLIGSILTIHSFEFYGMGQDEGVYQTEAVNFYYGRNEWSHAIPEIDNISDDEFKQFNIDSLSWWLGFDIGYEMDELYTPGFTYDENYTINGFWHGLPSLAAMLGLSARIFGVRYMMLINYIFYLCFIALAGLLFQKLNTNKIQNMLLTILAAVSPIIVWVAKSALTEMFFAVIIGVYLYLILNDNENARLLSIVPIISIMYFHISAYLLIPLFLLVYWYLYVEEKNKKYIILSYVTVITYLPTFVLTMGLNPVYGMKNITTPLKTDANHVFVIVAVACILGIVITFAISKMQFLGSMITEKRTKIFFSAITIIGLLYIVLLVFRYHVSLRDCRMMGISVYAVLSGIIILPMILAIIICGKYRFNKNAVLIYLSFFWTIIVFSFSRYYVAYYYYYSRYLAPYILVILVMFSYLVSNNVIPLKQKMQQVVFTTVIMIGIIILLPFSWVLKTNTDDSRLEWDVFESTLKELEEIKNTKDGKLVAAVDDGFFGLTMYYPVRAIADECYVINDEHDLDELESQGIKPDVIVSQREYDASDFMKLVYKQDSETEEDDLSQRSRLLGLPTNIASTNRFSVKVYKNVHTTNVMAGDYSSENFAEGWVGANQTGNRWTTDYTANIKAYLQKDDYSMKVTLGDQIPFDNLSFDEMNVSVSLNDEPIGDFVLPSESSITIELPKDFIIQGENTISFETDKMWSTTEYGGEDPNNYGFSVREINFERK